jgi:hypothetical protein
LPEAGQFLVDKAAQLDKAKQRASEAPFGAASDIDFFVESGQLTQGCKTSRNIPGFVHPEKILNDYPLLNGWTQKWTEILGREATPGAFQPGTLPQSPAILVK